VQASAPHKLIAWLMPNVIQKSVCREKNLIKKGKNMEIITKRLEPITNRDTILKK
jgi:hypothetical protein